MKRTNIVIETFLLSIFIEFISRKVADLSIQKNHFEIDKTGYDLCWILKENKKLWKYLPRFTWWHYATGQQHSAFVENSLVEIWDTFRNSIFILFINVAYMTVPIQKRILQLFYTFVTMKFQTMHNNMEAYKSKWVKSDYILYWS